MSRFTPLWALAAGAGLVYFFDPDNGARRRSLVRDRVRSTTNDVYMELETAMDDLRNQTQGVLARAQSKVAGKEVPDPVLAERARAQMGRYISHPGALNVSAEGGRVVVSGPILAHEVERLLKALQSVPGVKEVDNRLEVHETAGSVPTLQGEGRLRQPRPELLEEHWSPGFRLLVGIGGALLALFGFRRGLFGRLLLMPLGLVGVLRSVSNRPLTQVIGIDGERPAINVEKTIHINAPPERVYEFWSNFTNFPKFMTHVQEVRDLGGGRSHWRVAGPAGIPVEWEARVTQQVPASHLAWDSVPNQPVQNRGSVRFMPAEQGGTRVVVRLAYTPPAGAVGHAIASVMGADPKQAMDEDLLRLKSLIETGQTTAAGRTVTQAEVNRPTTR